MLLSVILAQIFGIYFLLMAIILVAKSNRIRAMIDSLEEDSDAVFISSIFSCFLGITLVVVHTYWALNWRSVISAIAWITLIKSLLWLWAPALMVKLTKKLYLGRAYYLMVAFLVILSIFLLFQGYSFMFANETIVIQFN